MVEYLGKDVPEKSQKHSNELDPNAMYLEQDSEKHPIHLGGYLNHEMRKNPDYTNPDYKNKQTQMVADKWNDIIENNPNVIPKNGVGVRRFIISPDPKKLGKLSKEEQEKVMHKTVRETMKKFKDKFYSKDQLGYAYSIHKDKAHMHAHVYMHTITKEGKYIAMNASKYVGGRKLNTKGTVDKLDTFKKMTKNSFDKEMKLRMSPSIEKRTQRQVTEKLVSKKAAFKQKIKMSKSLRSSAGQAKRSLNPVTSGAQKSLGFYEQEIDKQLAQKRLESEIQRGMSL